MSGMFVGFFIGNGVLGGALLRLLSRFVSLVMNGGIFFLLGPSLWSEDMVALVFSAFVIESSLC